MPKMEHLLHFIFLQLLFYIPYLHSHVYNTIVGALCSNVIKMQIKLDNTL